jgi:bilirubin oxidase
MNTRRRFLKLAATAGAGSYVAAKTGRWPQLFAQVPGGSLPPDRIPKFVSPLVIPAAMPMSASDATSDFYNIAVRQFSQQVLPAGFPRTTVWSYGAPGVPATFTYPALTIEATANRDVRVTWLNQLVDRRGNYLPHLLPVDQTLHWANPPGGMSGRDMPGTSHQTYRGPIPLVTHLHGGHTPDHSDGYPEAWFLPVANNIPPGYARVGSWYELFKTKYQAETGLAWTPGTATSTYHNDQRATALWYHDHALGLTRVNIYAGPVGFYLIRGGSSDLPAGVLPGPAPAVGDPSRTPYYEIPLVIQDRSFNADGSLFYPDNRAFFEGLKTSQLKIPFTGSPACDGLSDVPPIWNPEFFANTIIVNGQTWPYLDVERRRYRFRILNACNSRFLILKLSRPGVPFWQIGSEGGFLPAPIRREELLVALGERADVIVDFTTVPVGTNITMVNIGPDEPFGGGVPGVDFDPSDPDSTGQVIQFRVREAQSIDTSVPPESLVLPALAPLSAASVTRRLSLNEVESQTVLVGDHPGHGHKKHQPPNMKLDCGDPNAVPFAPTQALLGTLDGAGQPVPMHWMDAVTENPDVDATEVWEIYNFTEDAHPIHIHLVQFQILEREDANGVVRPPEAWESGRKDTMISFPGEIIRVKAHFDRAGQYTWHCHIIEHEDNEMMRPYSVGPVQSPTP